MNTPHWWLTKDGDVACLAMYERHYSAHHYADKRVRKLFVGPGEKVVLRTEAGDAFFVWRNFIDDSGQEGVNCAAFRNESRYSVHNSFAKRAQLLMQYGLIAGVIPMSIRKGSSHKTLDIAFSEPDGDVRD